MIIASGLLRSSDRGIVGGAAVDFIAQFNVDIGLIGVSSIESDGSQRDFDCQAVQVVCATIAH